MLRTHELPLWGEGPWRLQATREKRHRWARVSSASPSPAGLSIFRVRTEGRGAPPEHGAASAGGWGASGLRTGARGSSTLLQAAVKQTSPEFRFI